MVTIWTTAESGTTVWSSEQSGNSGNIIFVASDAANPVAFYSENQAVELDKFGAFVIRASDAGGHGTASHSAEVIETRPVGSGINGPATADFALSISNIKHNYPSSVVVGELDGVNVIVKNTVGDSAAYLSTTYVVDGAAFCLEGHTHQVDNSAADIKDISVQLAAINTANDSYGMVLGAGAGAMTAGIFIQDDSVGSWEKYLRFNHNGAEVFNVGTTGLITSAAGAAFTDFISIAGSAAFGSGSISQNVNWGMFYQSAQPSPNIGHFTWQNGASEYMRIDAAGILNVYGPIATAAPSTHPTNYVLTSADGSLIFSAAATLTLQAASTCPGRWLHLKNTAAAAIISASSNVVPLIGGSASTAILAATAGKWAQLQSDGTNWIIMAAN